MKIKKRLTQSEEFEIMKMVLDKFLWLGTGVMALGLYKMFTDEVSSGAWFLISGVVILISFVVIMVKEYEMIK